MNTILWLCLAVGVALCTPWAVAAAPAFDTAATESATGLNQLDARRRDQHRRDQPAHGAGEPPLHVLHFFGQRRATNPGIGVRRALDSQQALK